MKTRPRDEPCYAPPTTEEEFRRGESLAEGVSGRKEIYVQCENYEATLETVSRPRSNRS